MSADRWMTRGGVASCQVGQRFSFRCSLTDISALRKYIDTSSLVDDGGRTAALWSSCRPILTKSLYPLNPMLNDELNDDLLAEILSLGEPEKSWLVRPRRVPTDMLRTRSRRVRL